MRASAISPTHGQAPCVGTRSATMTRTQIPPWPRSGIPRPQSQTTHPAFSTSQNFHRTTTPANRRFGASLLAARTTPSSVTRGR
jgi:hypothetical protein